jgi:hypothetical protein
VFDFVKDLLSYLPGYLGELFHLTASPRQFIKKSIDSEVESAWKKALSFALVSFVLAFLINWLIVPQDQDFNEVLVGEGLVAFFVFFVNAVFVLWVCRLIMRVTAPPRIILIPFFYIAGVAMLISGFTQAAQFAVVKVRDPEVWTIMYKMKVAGNMVEAEAALEGSSSLSNDPTSQKNHQDTMRIMMLIALAGFIVELIWVFASWSVYKDMTEKSYFFVYLSLIVVAVLMAVNPVSLAKPYILMAI